MPFVAAGIHKISLIDSVLACSKGTEILKSETCIFLYLHKLKLLRELVGGKSIKSLKDHVNNKIPNHNIF